jgi:hypothetical protein
MNSFIGCDLTRIGKPAAEPWALPRQRCVASSDTAAAEDDRSDDGTESGPLRAASFRT